MSVIGFTQRFSKERKEELCVICDLKKRFKIAGSGFSVLSMYDV